jgi:plastocyanin
MRLARRPLALLAVLVALGSLGACSSASGPQRPPTFSHRPLVIVTTPPSTTGTFVSVAVDNHFHDIHPSDPPTISANRGFVVKNEGRNLHNFTVVGTLISVDIAPGHALRWKHIGHHVKPGFYQVFCKYHAYLGMTGDFYVTK